MVRTHRERAIAHRRAFIFAFVWGILCAYLHLPLVVFFCFWSMIYDAYRYTREDILAQREERPPID